MIVEDEADIRDLVGFHLEQEGYAVRHADTGERALALVASERPSLVMLDLMLPGTDGLDVCRRLRADEAVRDIPIIMLTAKAAEVDRVLGLEMGADDYVTKPFSPRELVARVRAVLRRSSGGGVYDRTQLLDLVWGRDTHVQPRTVDVHIGRLRKHLERDEAAPKIIVTVRGIGYKFIPEALDT